MSAKPASYSSTDLNSAIDSVLSGSTTKGAAKAYGVPESTLRAHVKRARSLPPIAGGAPDEQPERTDEQPAEQPDAPEGWGVIEPEDVQPDTIQPAEQPATGPRVSILLTKNGVTYFRYPKGFGVCSVPAGTVITLDERGYPALENYSHVCSNNSWPERREMIEREPEYKRAGRDTPKLRDSVPTPFGKRRQTVFDNSMVAHVWAHQSQPEGKSGNGNFSFSGAYLYSYDTVIGRMVVNRKGEMAALLNTHKYSITTSTKHQGPARSACSHLTQFYFDGEPQRGADGLRCMLAERIEQAKEATVFGRTTKQRAAAYGSLLARVESANKFCAFFDLKPFPQPATIESLETEMRAQRERKARAEKKAAAERDRKAREALADWLDGKEGAYRPYGLTTQYMRVVGNTVETTSGATVPLRHVQRIAPIILRAVRSEQEFVPETTIRFGHFTLDRVDEDGTVHVGCHKFTRAEIERFARVIESVPVPVGAPDDDSEEG